MKNIVSHFRVKFTLKMKARCRNPERQNTNRHHADDLSYFRRTNIALIQILAEWLNDRNFLCFVLVFPLTATLTLSNPIFLPPAYSPALIYFGRERGWWITCNYPTVLKEKDRNRKSTTCATCWLKFVLHEEKRREQENHNVGRGPT
jgi:hypothetical protein